MSGHLPSLEQRSLILEKRVRALEDRVTALEGEEAYGLTPKGKFVTDLISDGVSMSRACELWDKHIAEIAEGKG